MQPLRIESGLIAGALSPPTDPQPVYVYKGVPFAAPPVGPRRWRPPQPPAPWSGVRPCIHFGPSCPQPRSLMGGPVGAQSEDCLYLNIWTPIPPGAAESRALLPVMVWIHGGGHSTGSAFTPIYDGTRLARRSVVLVTINYRLGPFGYLGHPALSAESPLGVSGNYGLLDQAAALQWVRTNIAAFGGDPHNVTIFGESAGAVSVCRLMLSPLASGLFHRAIAQSGGVHGRNRHLRECWYGLESLEDVGRAVARRLDCERAADPAAALRDVPADKLLAAAAPNIGTFGGGIKFGPVIDGWAVPDDPLVLWQQGRAVRVPLIAGCNADEGAIFVRDAARQGTYGYHKTVARMFGEFADEALAMFPVHSDADVVPALSRLTTVASFAAPARFLVRAAAAAGAPAYLYHFTRVPDIERGRKLGAFHGLEIVYIFGNMPTRGGFDAADRALADALADYWVSVARTGDPNTTGRPHWPVYDPARDEHLELNSEPRVAAHLHRDACDLVDRMWQARVQRRDRGAFAEITDPD